MDFDFSKPGHLIRQRRQERGLSLADVARHLNVDKSLLSRLESGERGLPADKGPALAELLNLPDEYLRIAMGRLPDDVKNTLPSQAMLVTCAVRRATGGPRHGPPEGLSTAMKHHLVSTSTPKVGPLDSTLEGRIRAGKNTTVYRAHSYHTKVPPEAIVPIIEHFTDPGDVVLDPFCGSGMTGVAALQAGRHAVLSDLSPAAVHIARNYITPCSSEKFATALARVERRVRSTMNFLYEVRGPDGRRTTVEHTVWSDRFACPTCSETWSYWEATQQKVGRPAGKTIKCPRCGAHHRKQELNWVGEEPVVSSVSSSDSKRQDQHPPTAGELELITASETAPIPYWVPDVGFGRDREMWRAAHAEMRVTSVAAFYTQRNLHALAALRHAILEETDQRTRDALMWAFTGCLNRASKRYQWNKKRPTNVMTGTLYISSLRYEWNVWSLFKRKAADVARYYEAFPQTQGLAEVVPCSATALEHVPDRSIDFVFMDPPFGSNIFYGDSSLLWEAWLGRLTDLADEIVVNRHVSGKDGGKDAAEYARLLGRAFGEVRRVLKPGAQAVLAFSNTDDAVWEAIRKAIESAGLEVTTTAVLDKVHRSIKGVQADLGNERVTRLDLLIGLRARDVQATSDVPTSLALKDLVQVAFRAGAEAMATDEVYTAVVREALHRQAGLQGVSMAEVERVLSEVGKQDDLGQWSIEAAAQGRPFATSYTEAGASFQPLADGCLPKAVREAPNGAVKGSRSSAFYNAHSYHTKIPPEAIVPFIEHFTRPGDVVLDPFAGTGMTGVAATLLGRRCIVSDLSVIGAHLAYNHTRPCEPDALKRAFDNLYRDLLPKFREWYRTVGEDGREGYVHYTIWSKVYACPACGERFTMWSVTDTESGRVGRKLACPKCAHEAARQSWRAVDNVPVHISYDVPRRRGRFEKPADPQDLAHIRSFRRDDIDEWYPNVDVSSDREMYIRSALHLQGVSTVADFYTPRNLLALATVWAAIMKIEDERLRFGLAFAFTNTAWHGTKMRRYNARGGQRPLTGTLYIPQLSSEANVLEVMRNKVSQLCSYYQALTPANSDIPLPLVLQGSATHLPTIPDASVDYVFTDPPFGSNIFYADCNLIWEAWLGKVTDDTLEAVVNRSRKPSQGGKTVAEYEALMTESLLELHRVLKPGGWVTLVFHNTDSEVWAALQNAAAGAGFRIEGAAGLDRKQHSHKGYKGKNGTEKVAHFDVVLSMQKDEAVAREVRTPVTPEGLEKTLSTAATADPRVGASMQWAHSVVIRSLVAEGYDLTDLSYDVVHAAWLAVNRSGRPGKSQPRGRGSSGAVAPSLLT